MSTPSLKLISHKLCPYVQRARIVLAEKSIAHELEFIDLANKPDWFLAVSPLGRVPVLLVDGKPLFESAVIAEYLDEISEGSMHPDDPYDRARNRAWIEFASSTLTAIATFYTAPDHAAFEAATETLETRFQTLEAELGDGRYFNGPAFTIVDATFGPLFRYFDVIEQFEDFGFFSDKPKIAAWRRALRDRPSVQGAVVSDYAERLVAFILKKEGALASIIRSQQAA